MVALTTPICEFNKKAIDFNLNDSHGNKYTLKDCLGPHGLVVVFMCNHCPYVKAILTNLVNDLAELKQEFGVHSVAIMSNNVEDYPEDAPDKMDALSKEFNFTFPYLYDETQQVAKSYGAICTPDFFGYNKELKLQYRGQFDSTGIKQLATRGDRELFNAMSQIAKTGKGPLTQKASIGCSIKWK